MPRRKYEDIDIGAWRAAIGTETRDIPSANQIATLWEFMNERLANQETEIAIVIEDQYGYRLGEIWESSMFYAKAETPGKLSTYLKLCGVGKQPTDQ
ncbi:hypothetical protein [Cupriavidus pauculus]|uniref:hypothetical protein n=1 Tax=Cupriavidus pauculus TaxID=82633 RepID=UPI0030FC3650